MPSAWNYIMRHSRPEGNARQAGFTLVEALVALLVMSFGMLALAGFQIAMSRNSDVAKQRSEAVRLAQLKMEDLRSFDGLNSGTFTYETNVVSSTTAETICPAPTCTFPLDSTTNTTFARSWNVYSINPTTGAAVAAAAANLQKWIEVRVDWTDRTGEAQRVTLNSIIARNDPIELKGLVGDAARAKTRYPKNRQINIPYPAVTLSGGNTSAFIPPPGTSIYVFNNETGNVQRSCTPVPFTISALTRIGTSATAIATGHPFLDGDRVTVAGATPAGYNGDFVISSVVTGVSFRYTVLNSLATPASLSSASVRRIVTLSEGLDLSAFGAAITCTDINAYLLSGAVRFKISGSAPDKDNVADASDLPLLLSSAGPIVIDSTATGNGPSSYSCFAQSQKVISASNQAPVDISSVTRSASVVTVTTSGNHGYQMGQRVSISETANFTFIGSFVIDTVPTSTTFTFFQEGAAASTTGGKAALIQRITVEQSISVPGYNSTVSRFIAYTCVVTPNPSLTGANAGSWWGEAKLVTDGSWSFGATSSTYKVCRFSGDYLNDGVVSNTEHPRYYRQVKPDPNYDNSGTIDNQNYVVIRGNDDCPTDVAADPVNGDFVNASTVTHQTGASGTGVELSFKCTNLSCSGANKVLIEPADLAASVPMFK